MLDQFAEEIANFGSAPTMYAGHGGPTPATSQLYDGAAALPRRRRRDRAGRDRAPSDYADFIGEATLRDSYLKAPYYQAARLSRRASIAWARWRG